MLPHLTVVSYPSVFPSFVASMLSATGVAFLSVNGVKTIFTLFGDCGLLTYVFVDAIFVSQGNGRGDHPEWDKVVANKIATPIFFSFIEYFQYRSCLMGLFQPKCLALKWTFWSLIIGQFVRKINHLEVINYFETSSFYLYRMLFIEVVYGT